MPGTLSRVDCLTAVPARSLDVVLVVAGVVLGSLALIDWLGYSLFVVRALLP